MRVSAPAALGLIGLIVLLSACAQRTDVGAVPPPPPPAPAPALPDDADALVLQVEQTGGFLPAELLAGRLPLLSVYADGRVISEGPVVAVFPGPAWPNVQLQQADPAVVRTLLAHALATGVADPTDLGSPGVTDAASTRFTVTTADGTTVREVYALAEGDGDPVLTAQQQAARTRLTELFTELTDLPSTLSPPDHATAGHQPTAVAALVRPWTAPEGDPVLDPSLAQPELAWPGPELPAQPTGPGLVCVLATGEQARAVAAAAQHASRLTPWTTADGARWSITFRPLLPHETGCADVLD